MFSKMSHSTPSVAETVADHTSRSHIFLASAQLNFAFALINCSFEFKHNKTPQDYTEASIM